jgi:hypothetical protein
MPVPHSLIPRSVACCLLSVACCLLPVSSSAAPVLTVKGHTIIRLLGIVRTAEGAILSGQLQDRDLGSGVAQRSVVVSYREGGATRTVRATTDENGEFRALLPGTGTAFQVEARFAGDLNYASESYPAETLDVTKQNVELELAGGNELDASKPSQRVLLRARADGQPVRIALTLRSDRGSGLARLQTDARGEAAVTLATSDLGAPGRLEIFVHFAGDDRLNPATRRFGITLTTPVQITLRAVEPRVETGDEIKLEGLVRDVSGPLAGATVHLDVMGRQTASTVSDGSGRFSFRQDASDFPPGRLDLVARYAPAVAWRRPSSSAPVEVVIQAPRPIPLRLYLAPALFTCAVLLVLLALRRGPALLRWLRALRSDEDGEPTLIDEIEVVRSGLRPSRSSGGLRALVRQAHDVWGTVWDPTDRCPLPGATLQLLGPGGQTLVAQADAHGRFKVQALADGIYRVRVLAAGYVTEQFDLQIPHRGQLHDVRVDLVQVRVRLLELYREAALPLLPDRELWARWTPRELLRHVGSRAGRRMPPLDELTGLLERAYWSGHPPAEQLIVDARGLAAHLRQPTARP